MLMVNPITYTDVNGSGTFGSINLSPFFDPGGPTHENDDFAGTAVEGNFFSGDYATALGKAGGDSIAEAAFLDSLYLLTADGASHRVTQGYADLLDGAPTLGTTVFTAGTAADQPYRLGIEVDIYA